MKKPSRKTLKNKADKLFSERIRKFATCRLGRDKFDDIKCNGDLQCAHIIGRANHRLRWDLANALPLCQAHHLYYTHQPWAWQELIKTRFPERYEYLNSVRNEIWDKDIEKVLSGL